MLISWLTLIFSDPAFAGAPLSSPVVLAVSAEEITEYDAIRVALLADNLDSAKSASTALIASNGADQDLAAAANTVATAPDVTTARAGFSALSRTLALRLSTASGAPRVVTYFCPMYQGYGWWFQPKSGIGNPYMGQSMPTCGEEKSLKAAVKALVL